MIIIPAALLIGETKCSLIDCSDLIPSGIDCGGFGGCLNKTVEGACGEGAASALTDCSENTADRFTECGGAAEEAVGCGGNAHEDTNEDASEDDIEKANNSEEPTEAVNSEAPEESTSTFLTDDEMDNITADPFDFDSDTFSQLEDVARSVDDKMGSYYYNFDAYAGSYNSTPEKEKPSAFIRMFEAKRNYKKRERTRQLRRSEYDGILNEDTCFDIGLAVDLTADSQKFKDFMKAVQDDLLVILCHMYHGSVIAESAENVVKAAVVNPIKKGFKAILGAEDEDDNDSSNNRIHSLRNQPSQLGKVMEASCSKLTLIPSSSNRTKMIQCCHAGGILGKCMPTGGSNGVNLTNYFKKDGVNGPRDAQDCLRELSDDATIKKLDSFMKYKKAGGFLMTQLITVLLLHQATMWGFQRVLYL